MLLSLTLVLSGHVRQAQATLITFATPITISADTDVVTNGTAVFANNLGGIATTVNGVLFTAGQSISGTTLTLADGLSTIVSPTGTFQSLNGTFAGANPPFTSLSTAYTNLLRAGVVEPGNGADVWTVNLNGLTEGRTYTVQLWVNDSRGNTRSQTVASGNSVVLAMSTPTSNGGVGQFTTGTFVADATTQSFTVNGSFNTQLNAIQLRDLGVVPEPATLTLIGLGLGLSVWMRGKRTR